MRSPTTASFGYQPRKQNWTSLRLLNIFRLGLASIFFSQSFIHDSPLLYIYELSLYAWTSFGYLLLALIMTLSSWIERRYYQVQIAVQVYFDIIAIILLMHACGGISSGLGMLLIISIAVTGMLAEARVATVFASLATVGLLVQYFYAAYYTQFVGTSTQVGLLGAALFATALVTQNLTLRIRRSEELIQQQKLDVANLSALNSEILQNMQSGVLALDSNEQVRHINDMAKHMLKDHFIDPVQASSLPFDARSVLPEIYQALSEWRDASAPSSRLLSSGKTGFDIQVSFHQLDQQGDNQRSGLLQRAESILLEVRLAGRLFS